MIREATAQDVTTIRSMIVELAEYERSSHEVLITEAQLQESLFGAAPRVHAHVAELDGELVGFALWFLNFSTWRGTHGIYLEDLYVRPDHRGAGHGRALLATLARICRDRGYERLEWSVLDWNAPAIEFYRSLGAIAMDEWTMHRLSDNALIGLTEAAPPR